jgi:hypothetical protein
MPGRRLAPGAKRLAALIITPATLLDGRSLVRTADPTGAGPSGPLCGPKIWPLADGPGL